METRTIADYAQVIPMMDTLVERIGDDCKNCPFRDEECSGTKRCLMDDIKELLERGCDREAELEHLMVKLNQVERERDALIPKAVLCEEAIAAGAKMQRERDAAIEDLRGACFRCTHFNDNNFCFECMHFCPFDDECFHKDHWQWRGPQEVPHD